MDRATGWRSGSVEAERQRADAARSQHGLALCAGVLSKLRANRVEVAVVGETAEIRIDDGTVLLVEDMPPGPAQVCLTVRMHSMEVGFDQVLKQLPEESLPAGSET